MLKNRYLKNRYLKNRYLKNVTTLKLIADNCTGCGICTDVCPHQILSVREDRCEVSDRDLCMECGACMINCPFNAIWVKKGVGCFDAIVNGIIRGAEPSCDCSGDSGGCC